MQTKQKVDYPAFPNPLGLGLALLLATLVVGKVFILNSFGGAISLTAVLAMICAGGLRLKMDSKFAWTLTTILCLMATVFGGIWPCLFALVLLLIVWGLECK